MPFSHNANSNIRNGWLTRKKWMAHSSSLYLFALAPSASCLEWLSRGKKCENNIQSNQNPTHSTVSNIIIFCFTLVYRKNRVPQIVIMRRWYIAWHTKDIHFPARIERLLCNKLSGRSRIRMEISSSGKEKNFPELRFFVFVSIVGENELLRKNVEQNRSKC